MPEKQKGTEGESTATQRGQSPKPRTSDADPVDQEESLKVHGDKYEGLIPGAAKKPSEESPG